jgi:hypothetical protein
VDYGRPILVHDGYSLMEGKSKSVSQGEGLLDPSTPEIERVLNVILPPRYIT